MQAHTEDCDDGSITSESEQNIDVMDDEHQLEEPATVCPTEDKRSKGSIRTKKVRLELHFHCSFRKGTFSSIQFSVVSTSL